MVEVWHVRHGERADEVSGAEKPNWKKTPLYRSGRYYDPPLTKIGHVQATTAGRYIKSLPFNKESDRESSGFDRVYTSPLLRAVQTACCISRELGGLPLQIVPGLAACTAAMARIGFESSMVMEDADVRDAFPEINLLPRDPSTPASFEGVCSWLATRDRKRILAVGHREGMKHMARRKVPTPHCCIGIFRAELIAGSRSASYVMQNLLLRTGLSLRNCDAGTFEPVETTVSEDDVTGWLTQELTRPDGFLTGERWLRKERPGKSVKEANHHRHGSAQPRLRGTPQAENVEFARRATGKAKESTAKSRLLSKPLAKGSIGSNWPATKVEKEATLRVTSRTTSTDETCAGNGFRVATLSRKSSVEGVNKSGLLALTLDGLSGLAGALSYLEPLELCMAKSICKRMAAVSEYNSLWREIFVRLPEKLRDRTNAGVGLHVHDTRDGKSAQLQVCHKELFVNAVNIMRASQSSRMKSTITREYRRLGTLHGLRSAVEAVNPSLVARLNGKLVGLLGSMGTRSASWASRANVLSEPSSRGSLRMFTLSSSVKIEVHPSMSMSQLHSVCTAFPKPTEYWVSGAVVWRADEVHLSRKRRLLGKSADGSLTLYEISGSSGGLKEGNDGGSPITRACSILGVLSDDAVGLMSVHMPHQLTLCAATQRTAQLNISMDQIQPPCGNDSGGQFCSIKYVLAALGLRTVGVPLWEASVVGAPTLFAPSQGDTISGGHCSTKAQMMFRMDLVSPEGNTGVERSETALSQQARTLSGSASLPFITSGGLIGVVEDVVLVDFTLFGPHGHSVWAFTAPMVLEAVSNGGSFDGANYNTTFDMSYSEVRADRRRGTVVQEGVGKLVIELISTDADQAPRPSSPSLRGHQAQEHVWMVRMAQVEFDCGLFMKSSIQAIP